MQVNIQGPLICHPLVTPEVLLVTCNIMIINVLSCLVTQMLYFSQFFPSFFVGLCRICLCANALNLEYQHLFIACKN